MDNFANAVKQDVNSIVTQVAPNMIERAHPLFPGGPATPANNIRGYYEPWCCGLRPGTGPDVPEHWLDSGHGWTTAHFVDIEPFNLAAKQPGRHKCKYCDFVAEGDECCGKGCCWCALAKAPGLMVQHLTKQHGMAAPSKREWATGCTETTGCMDACLCWQCQASRQIMASHGFKDQINWCWCLYFTFCAQRNENQDGDSSSTGLIVLAAWMNRNSIVQLHNIDEGCCKTCLMAACCPWCSIAQTYREFSAGGVWPGGVCQGSAPPSFVMNNPPPSMIAKSKIGTGPFGL